MVLPVLILGFTELVAWTITLAVPLGAVGGILYLLSRFTTGGQTDRISELENRVEHLEERDDS